MINGIRIILGCEESDEVRSRFELLGFDAWSCDLMPSRNPNNKKHIQGDIMQVLNGGWDCGIFFPPCTHLATSGAKHFMKKRMDGRQREAIEFFLAVAAAPMKYTAIENPVGIMSGDYVPKHFPRLMPLMRQYGFPRPPDQIINPWMFGDEAQKTTCLWLKGLPLLYHNKAPNLFDEVVTHVGKGEFYISPQGKKLPAWYGDTVGEDGKKLAYASAEIKKIRSKTFPGIANAMATQWGQFLLEKVNK